MKSEFFLIVFLLFVSCSEKNQKAAESLLSQAEQSYEDGSYNDAKVLIDSIESNYTKCFDVRKSAQLLMYRINLAIEENTLKETDSLIQAIIPKINETTEKYFVFEKSEYDELGRFMFKGTEVENNVQRSYIHSAVNEYGVTQLISTYSGGKDINHTALKIIASDGSNVTTQSIPYNDGSNYKYVIDGTHYESVTYQGDKDNGVLAFIASHADDKGLKAVLIGENKEVNVSISQKEREALAATYELGIVLSEQLLFTQQNKVAAGKISYLKEKILSKTATNN